jgi:hypothetical protein
MAFWWETIWPRRVQHAADDAEEGQGGEQVDGRVAGDVGQVEVTG